MIIAESRRPYCSSMDRLSLTETGRPASTRGQGLRSPVRMAPLIAVVAGAMVAAGLLVARTPSPADAATGATKRNAKGAAKAVKLVPAKFSEDVPYVAPEFTSLQNWVNSGPLTLAALKGKVVLVNFWTFGCYNCKNTIPHMKALYDKYHDQGFEIVGLHAPEFDYEKDAANVKRAVAKEGIAWPVAQDNGFKTWRRYKNGFWPAFYYLDKSGKVRHLHIGEGGYANQDAVVAALLAEATPA